MKWTLVVVAAAALAAPQVAVAQPPRSYFPWWDSPMAKDLNLTDSQQQQIRQTVKEYRGKLIDLRAAVEKAEGDLEDQFSDSYVDQRRAAEAIERLAQSRAELTKAFAQMSLQLRGVLTVEQWRELQKRSPRGPMGRPQQQRINRRQPGQPGTPPPPQQQQ